MQKERNLSGYQNPLDDIIDDATFEELYKNKLFNDKAIRDYKIRRMFRDLRTSNMNAGDAIDKIREQFPYLQFDTVRKIVYQISK